MAHRESPTRRLYDPARLASPPVDAARVTTFGFASDQTEGARSREKSGPPITLA